MLVKFNLMRLILTTVFIFFFTSIFSQKKFTGTTTDASTGKPVSGTTVSLRGSKNATVTNEDGTFTINLSDANSRLVISHVGYEPQEISTSGKSDVIIQLTSSSSSNLNEVVVVGYGTQKRSSLTGAVATVSNKTLNELPVSGIDQALQGRVSGLSITNNGSPGMAPIIAIRGISSVTNVSDPLYVIDGFPTGNLNSFDVKDVESVEVLKDASAAAIYGSRATNGVILVTTKKGRRDNHLSVNFDSYIGIQSPAKKISLLNTSQYLQYAKALLGPTAYGNVGRLKDSAFNSPVYDGATQTYAQTNTNWQDEYFVDNALLTQSNVSVSGGNEKSRFYSSAGYFKQDGIAQGLNYERGNFRLNSEHKISNIFTFGQNLYLAYGNQRVDGTGGNRSPLTNVVRMLPYIPLNDPTKAGGFQGPQTAFDGSDPTNPVELAVLNEDRFKTLKLLGTAYADVNFTSWLRFRSTFGVDYTNQDEQKYLPIFNDGGTSSATSATINNERKLYTTFLYTQQLTFEKEFGKHQVNATAVYEQQGQGYKDEVGSGNQATNQIRTLQGASNISVNSRIEANLIKSYIGRVTYDYANKYLLSASLRRDGLSVFAPGHKFRNFPAASIGWRIDQEDFMQDYKDNISELKLRAGYGLTGINGVLLGNYPYLVPVQANQTAYPFDGTITGANGSYYNRLGNTNLEWETTKQLNIGLDLGLFRNAFTLTAEYFKRTTDNLIINVPIPSSFGFGSSGNVATNAAGMENRGFELQLGYHKTTGAFKWDVSGLLSVIKNKVTKLNSENASFPAGADADFGNGAITNTIVGQPIQSFYGWIVDGIFQTAAEVASSAVQVAGTDPTKSTQPGDLKFRDISGPDGKPDGKITDADRTFIGSFLPKFTYSLNGSASYKNFDISIFFQGVQGNKIFNAERVISEGMIRLFNSSTAVLDAWTSTNTATDIPRAISGDPNQNARVSTRWIEDGSYLRLKNVILGYSIPTANLKAISKIGISRLHIYVSSQNLVTFSKYKGWDPEVGAVNTKANRTLTTGIDYGQYPSARSFQVGLQATF